MNLDEFLASYIGTAMWSSNDESREDGGDPIDDNYDRSDLAPKAEAEMRADCERFLAENAAALSSCTCSRQSDTSKATQCGHDFWLTRNGHGAGFWDGDYSEPEATQLTDASKKFRECHLCVGDDGKVYCE